MEPNVVVPIVFKQLREANEIANGWTKHVARSKWRYLGEMEIVFSNFGLWYIYVILFLCLSPLYYGDML